MNPRLLFLSGMLAASLSSTAWSVPVSTVGSHDLLIGTAVLASSGSAAEQTFVSSVLPGYTLTGKYGWTTDGGPWEAVDGLSGHFAIDFGAVTCQSDFIGVCSTAPDYFLIKVGIGKSPTGTPTHYLFENLAAMQWAYVTLSDFPGVTNIGIGKVSHISVGDGDVPVPAPATLALLGLGALGLGLARRRKQQS